MPTTSNTIPEVTLNTGAKIPQLGYGTLALQPDRESNDANAKITEPIVSQALQAGYRHIDTAQAYGTELENLDVFDFELTDEQIAAIDALDRGADGRVGPNPDTYEGV